MPKPVNDPISWCERVVRNIYYPSQEDKKGHLKKTATYPAIKEDRDEPEYFNNKISLQRVCRASENHAYAPVVTSALSFERENKTLKGFLEWSCIGIYTTVEPVKVSVVPDASEKNPFHLHLIIDEFRVKYTEELKKRKAQKQLGYSDFLPSTVKAALDRMRDTARPIRIVNGCIEGQVSPCSGCTSVDMNT